MSYFWKYDILRSTLLCIGIFILWHSAFSNHSFDKANTYYKDKQYALALQEYLLLVKPGDKKPAVYFNLANTYYQLKQYPKAVLYFEKALKFDPGNDKIEHNLKLARNKSLTKIEESKDFFVFKFIRNFIREYGARTWSVAFLFCLWISVIAFIFYFNKMPGTGSFYFRSGITGLFFSFILFFIAKERFREQTSYRNAIVLQSEAELKTDPVKNAKTKTTIEAGNKVFLLDKDANWYKISLPNGKQGWIDEKAIVKI